MESTFNFVHYKVVNYVFNKDSYRYEKLPQLVSFAKLPNELKIESTIDKKIIQQGADKIITGRIKNGKRLFFTGLIQINEHFFLGNDYEILKGIKKLSLCVFHFSEDLQQMTIYYFNRFYKENQSDKLKFVQSFINHLQQV